MLSSDAQSLIHPAGASMSQAQSTQYELRDLTRAEDLELLEEIQKRAWNYDDREVTPGSLMVASVHTGGIVVGAYPDRKSVV